MVDAGSTTRRFAQELAIAGLAATVITNPLGVATALGAAQAVRVLLCPGRYVGHEHGVYGAEACAFLERYRADLAVISGSGLAPDGLNDADPEAASTKRVMIARAARTLVLADYGKFGLQSLAQVCPLAGLDELVTDARPQGALAKALKRAGVAVRVG